MERLQLTIEDSDGFRVAHVGGELDTFVVASFRERLGVLRSSDRYVVDLVQLGDVTPVCDSVEAAISRLPRVRAGFV